MPARRLFPRRHASGQFVRRQHGQAGRGRFRHHGPAGAEGAALPRRDLFGFITRDYQRTAQVHFDAGYVPRHHSVESFAQAIRAIGEPIHNRTAEESRWRSCDAAVRGHRPVRHAYAARTVAAAEDHGGRRGRRAARSIRISTCGRPPIRWCANGSSASRSGRQTGGRRRRRRRDRPFLAQVPGLLTRGATLLDQFDDLTRDGLVLSPETIEAIGRAEARRNRWASAALWVIAALLAWIAWMLPSIKRE